MTKKKSTIPLSVIKPIYHIVFLFFEKDVTVERQNIINRPQNFEIQLGYNSRPQDNLICVPGGPWTKKKNNDLQIFGIFRPLWLALYNMGFFDFFFFFLNRISLSKKSKNSISRKFPKIYKPYFFILRSERFLTRVRNFGGGL